MTLDPAALANLLDITGGDAAFVDELVDTFLADAEAQLAALHAAVASDDSAAIQRPAHSLKTNSLNVGATVLADLTKALEQDARAGSVPDAGTRVEAVAVEFGAVREALLAERAAR
jgi:HPt (histidine-containing phosphotransfer) domain-containing protein